MDRSDRPADYPVTRQQASRLGGWLEVAAVVAIAGLAAFLRYYQIEQVPPGLNSDEAVGAMGALETLRSGLRLYYAGQGGGGALGFYIVALAFAMFGPSVATLRGTAAFAGVVSVVATYFLTRQMFRPWARSDRAPSDGAHWKYARQLALVAALGLATSLWHVQSSRVAFAAIGVPFLYVPGSYFLWRGLHSGRRIHFVISGVLLAAVMSIYLSGLFVPISYLIFFLLQWLLTARQPAGPLLKTHLRNLMMCAGVAFVLCLPLLYFFLSTPELATARAQQALFTNPNINQGDAWGTLWRGLWGNLAGFGLSLSWLQGEAPANLIWPAPVAWLFLVGAAVSLWRARHPAYLFALVSWAVMIIPSILSPDLIPHGLRAAGAAPAAYILVAIGALAVVPGVGKLARYILARRERAAAPLGLTHAQLALRRILPLGVAIDASAILAMAVAGPLYDSYYHYMAIWPDTDEAQAIYHVYAVKLADQMSQEDNPQAVFLLPRDTAAGDVNPNYTVMFLYRGQAGYAWIVDNEDSLEATLKQALAGRRLVHVVHWKVSKHTGADPKEIIRYYLEKHGHFVQTRKFQDFDIVSYELDRPDPDWSEPPLVGVTVRFGDAIELSAYALGDASGRGRPDQASVPAGDLAWVRLRFRLLRPGSEDLKASVIIADANGHVVGQIDKLLLNNIWHQGTSQWQAGSQADAYFLVPVAPASPPGDYYVGVAVYGAESRVRLPVTAELAVDATYPQLTRVARLGKLAIERDRQVPSPAQLGIAQKVEQRVAPGLRLVGYTLGQETLRPGQQTSVMLVWQAEGQPARDYQARVWARRAGQAWPLSDWQPLAGIDYPSSRWQPGQLVRAWFDLRLPAELASDAYQLALQVGEASGPWVNDFALGRLAVSGWPRRFELPAMQHVYSANLGDQIELLGYDLSLPGQTSPNLEVTLYWRALTEMATNYTSFVHVLDASGQIAAQLDHVPGDGAFPTSGWLPGEVIADHFSLRVPAERGLTPESAQLELGLYDPATMVRLPRLDAAGQVVDTRILVSPAGNR